MLISKSDKPFKILRQLQASRRILNSSENHVSKNMQRIRLKAK